MQRLLLKFLLLLPTEFAHHLTLKLIRWFYTPARVQRCLKQFPSIPTELAGLSLPNPIGLGAGLDKNAECIDAWFALGFGFVEVGTVTPKPQAGNPKPRLFRLRQFNALINRMGFNNEGVEIVTHRLKQRKVSGIVGINIGKNRDTPLEKAVDDYLFCLEKVYPYVDYVTVNISSPNTVGLRQLQNEAYLDDLLASLMSLRHRLAQQQQREVPIFIKIAPDLDQKELASMLVLFLKHKIDGVIATNTSIERESVALHSKSQEAGGLSGGPIYQRSRAVVTFCIKELAGRIPVIAVGGIDSPKRALAMLELGASAIQLYSGFIYQGPRLIAHIINSLKK